MVVSFPPLRFFIRFQYKLIEIREKKGTKFAKFGLAAEGFETLVHNFLVNVDRNAIVSFGPRLRCGVSDGEKV